MIRCYVRTSGVVRTAIEIVEIIRKQLVGVVEQTSHDASRFNLSVDIAGVWNMRAAMWSICANIL